MRIPYPNILANPFKIFFVCSLYTFHPFYLSAQSNINGRVIDKKNRTPIEGCTIILKNNNSTVTLTNSDSLGVFSFKSLNHGNYLIQAFKIGFFDTSISIDIPYPKDQIEVFLSSKNDSLKNIIVKGQKPNFERRGDRFSFDVEKNKFLIGTNAWDLLKITPLVIVTDQGGIGISGTTGAKVYINDRKIQVSGAALVSYLKAINSDNIIRIEVITIPSSKFDAEGGGGIINIVLKKNDKEGLKGNASFSSSQATYNSQSIGGNIDIRKGKFNISASVNQRRDNLLFTGINDLQAINSQGNHFYSNYNVFERRLHNKLSFSSNIGIDFLINPKNTISLLADYSHISLSRPSQTNTRFIQLPGNTVDSLYKTFSDNWEKTNFLNNSLIYELRLDSSKKKLTISADFLHYSETRNSCQTTFLSDQQDSLTAIKDHFLSLLPQKIQNATAAIDYSWTGRKISIESGIKYSNSNTDNNVQFQIPNGSQYIVDTSRSNHFKYLERIAGVYFTLKGKFNKKIDYQVGLRYENTFTKGNSVTYDQIKTGNYDNLFHTIFINYIPNKVHQFSFASTSRINRPGFWDINPFRYYTSNTIFVTGNPSLLPSRIYRQEFTYTYKGKFVVQITHSLTKNSFALLNFFQGQEEYQQQTNYGKKESSGINLVYNNRLLPIWFLRLNADLAFLNYDIDLGNKIISQRTHRLEISVLNGLTLSTKKKIYLTSITRNSFMRYSENTRINNQFRTDISAMKVSKDQKWTFTLSVADIFRSAQDKYLTESVSNSFDEKYYYDARNISIGFSYSFGKNSIPNIKQKTIKNQEIKNRVK